MKQITVETHPSEEKLKKLGVKHWPTWQKEVSTFPWHFVTTEYAYILEGECVMTPEDGSPAVTFNAGDLVIFPNGFKGTWEVTKSFKKQFKHVNGNLAKCLLCRLKILVNRIKSLFG